MDAAALTGNFAERLVETFRGGLVPGAEAELSETDGHLTFLVNRVGEIHEWLLARF